MLRNNFSNTEPTRKLRREWTRVTEINRLRVVFFNFQFSRTTSCAMVQSRTSVAAGFRCGGLGGVHTQSGKCNTHKEHTNKTRLLFWLKDREEELGCVGRTGISAERRRSWGFEDSKKKKKYISLREAAVEGWETRPGWTGFGAGRRQGEWQNYKWTEC